MQLKYSQLSKNGDIAISGNWLLVTGGEEHFKRLLAERLREQLLRDEDSFNFDLLDLNERWEGINETGEKSKRSRQPTRVDRIISRAQELPFLGNGRLLLVRNFELLPTDQQKKLAAALTSIPPTNHVILVTGAGEKGKTIKLQVDLTRGVDKNGIIFDCAPLNETEATAWINSTLAEWGQKMESSAAKMLLSRVGSDIRRVQIELEKLSLLAGNDKMIRREQVEMMTPKLAEESVFNLTNALVARDARRAMDIIYELIEEQMEQPFAIFALISWQFRMIWQTKILLDAGWSPGQDPNNFPRALAILPEQNAIANIRGFMGNKLAGRARQISWEQMTSTFQALLECDMAGKAIIGVPQQDLKISLELLCVKLCQPPGR